MSLSCLAFPARGGVCGTGTAYGETLLTKEKPKERAEALDWRPGNDTDLDTGKGMERCGPYIPVDIPASRSPERGLLVMRE